MSILDEDAPEFNLQATPHSSGDQGSDRAACLDGEQDSSCTKHDIESDTQSESSEPPRAEDSDTNVGQVADAVVANPEQRCNELLLEAQQTSRVECAYEAASFIAQLPASVAGPMKARFKQALGDSLNLNDLNKAIGEASKKLKVHQAKQRLKSSLPAVFISNRPLRDTSTDALNALYELNSPPRIYVRAASLVRVRRDEEGRPFIEQLNHSHLRRYLTRSADFLAGGCGEGDEEHKSTHVSPPDDIIQDILTHGSWHFPVLEAISEAPVFKRDGSILSRPGYDSTARLLYMPVRGFQFPNVSTAPTKAELAAALDLIDDMIGEFPFADDASRANAYGLLLTPIVRPAIQGCVPMALIDAPQPGTGKSLLAEIVSRTATGRPAAMMTECGDEEEWGKALTSVLLEGSTINIIDNVENPLKSAKLAALLTASVFRHRVLGRNAELPLPNRGTWIATGNSIRVGGDMARRCYVIRLDARVPRPYERENFKHSDLPDWVCRNLGPILAALLTLAVYWHAAGRPKPKVKVIGGFAAWTNIIGGILEQAGIEGFLANRYELYDQADEEESEWQLLFESLSSHYGGQSFSIADLYKVLIEIPDLRAALPAGLSEDLELSELNGSPGGFTRSLGKAFAKRENRRYGDRGLRLERAGNQGHAVLWHFVTDCSA